MTTSTDEISDMVTETLAEVSTQRGANIAAELDRYPSLKVAFHLPPVPRWRRWLGRVRYFLSGLVPRGWSEPDWE